MEHIALAFQVREEYPEKKIALVYNNESSRKEAVQKAINSHRWKTDEFNDRLRYTILGRTDSEPDIVAISSLFRGEWRNVTDIWYDDNISTHNIDMIKSSLLRQRIDIDIYVIPFSKVSLTYHIDDLNNLPVEQDDDLEAYLCELSTPVGYEKG